MCKKIISFFQRTPGLPAVAVSVVFLVIYLFGSCIFKNMSQKEITEGLDGIGIIANIAIALALLEITIRIGYGQIKVQRDNIKIQMFDKRYAVYEAIADSLDIAMRKDYSDFVLSGMIDLFAINKLINDQ